MRQRMNQPIESRGPLKTMFMVTSMPVGGAETLLVNLIRRLDRDRFAPELCCLKELGPLGEEMEHEIPTFHHLLGGKYDLRVVPRLIELFRLREIDAVVTVGAGDKMFWGRLCAWLAGVPVIASAIHSTGWPDSINWLNRQLTSVTDRFIGVAAPHGKYLIDVEGFPPEKVTVIPNGIDTDRFVPNAEARTKIRQELNIGEEVAVCGIVAALRPEKDHALFLRAAARVHERCPSSHFLIVGDGPERASIEALRSELGLDDCVTLTGSRSDIPELLAAMDCFALTSKNEASPVSILEAMSAGLPVVAPRVGSIPDAIDDSVNGILVEASNLEQTADGLTTLMEGAPRRSEMGKSARAKAKKYGSLETMVAGYQDLISGIYRQKVQAALHAARQPTSQHVFVPQPSKIKAP
ncbi:glycosyl transferase family 1 [Blastopirellula marina]|uniref:Glycosyl transferase family 1 n=2 Tax=Blastopirellula marina TaxID=124 RepID=A0A2S8F4Z9_9BACT|nr:glycosyl transferase family 1 [Blastopirellula marina]PTL41382.1 glycosyl transferase family 1 [Blastopirellula marina]